MFLGRPEFHRMVLFRGWGVSENAAFLGRDWHFTVNLKIMTRCGKAQDGAISRAAELQRIRRFSVDWHFTVDLQIRGCGKWQDAANGTIGVISRSVISENAAFERTGCYFTINLQTT